MGGCRDSSHSRTGHGIKIGAIADLIQYRSVPSAWIERVGERADKDHSG